MAANEATDMVTNKETDKTINEITDNTTDNATAKAVDITNLSGGYGRRQILKNLTLQVERGECTAIAGPNGCGKSTLLSIMAGTMKPTGGSIRYFGYDTLAGKSVFRRMTGYVPQENPLMPELNVYDNLRLWYPDKQTLEKELEEGFLHVLGIPDFVKMRADRLSAGMQKRVNIGIALAGMPPILLLDEPAAALDLIGKEEIGRYLSLYLQKKGTIVIATHEEQELALCDHVYVMKTGELHEVDKTLRGKGLTAMFC